jgi:hypothetical protein
MEHASPIKTRSNVGPVTGGDRRVAGLVNTFKGAQAVIMTITANIAGSIRATSP